MKKILAILIIALLLVAGLTACNGKTEEEILPETTIQVSNASELALVKNYVGAKYSKYTIELTDDIDLSDIDIWEPIGHDADHAFCGVFDGKEHTISHLTVNGVENDGSPKFVAKDKGVENVSSFASYGLFGYVNNATIKKVSLTNVDMNYYIDHSGYSYVGGLVGISLGASTYSDVDVDGKVVINNLYRKYKTYDNRGQEQSLADECTATLFFGGVVAYSNGNSTFNKVTSYVDFDNDKYCAYYVDESSVLSEDIPEGTTIESKYDTTYQSTLPNTKLDQVIAGGVIGQMKGGKLTDGTYYGSLNVRSASAYAAGVVGAAYSAEIVGSHANNAKVDSRVIYKCVAGGISALVDEASIKDSATNSVNIVAGKIRSDVQTVTAGGIFGYGSNLASVTGCTSTNATVSAAMIGAEVGGIGGVVKDSTVKDCLSTGTTFILDEYSYTAADFGTYATVVSAVYGNSLLKDCAGAGNNKINGVLEPNGKANAIKGDSVYPNDRGEPAIRLYKKGSNSIYLAVDGKVENTTLIINIYNEELTLLTTARYTDASAGFVYTAGDNVAEKYVAYYFGDNGFRNDDNGAVTVEGRDATGYEFRSGKSTIDNVVVGTAIIK